MLPDCAATILQVPEKVLDTRVIKRGDTEVPQVLIKWSSMDSNLSTWKIQSPYDSSFQLCQLGVKQALKPGGMSASLALVGRKQWGSARELQIQESMG
jgi:hypothetical protein